MYYKPVIRKNGATYTRLYKSKIVSECEWVILMDGDYNTIDINMLYKDTLINCKDVKYIVQFLDRKRPYYSIIKLKDWDSYPNMVGYEIIDSNSFPVEYCVKNELKYA